MMSDRAANVLRTWEGIVEGKTETRYHDVARSVADLVVSKQAAYGDSFGKSGNVMRELYPNGIRPDQLDDALTVVRVVDKLFRIATDRDAFGEDPWRDVLGYSLLAVERKSRKPVDDGPPVPTL